MALPLSEYDDRSATLVVDRWLAATIGFVAATAVVATAVFAAGGSPVVGVALLLAGGAASVDAVRRVRRAVAGLAGALRDMSSRDQLTGALRADAFSRAWDGWVGNGLRRSLESSLVLIDVDTLDEINRTQGHEAGDRALQFLAQIVRSCIRETDAFGRLEGDEFALLFPATSGDEALTAAERIRAEVAAAMAAHRIPLTVSVGVTGAHAFQDPWAAARRALDLAKAAGRNCVVLAETETQAERLPLSALRAVA